MPVNYAKRDGRQYGTITCDDCGAVFDDGKPESPGPDVLIRAGDQGWSLYRPNPYRANNACPACLPAALRRHPRGRYT